ncbi:hypothetical protein ACQ0P2_05095, partial [Streptococcus canis]
AGVTWRWSLNEEVTTGMTYLVKGSSVTDTVTLTVAAYIGNDEVAVDEISFVNVVDGKLGTPGTPGRDGRTPYVHTAWANNATGTDGFSLDSSINKLYIGIYTDFEPNDSTDPTKYKWTKIKGDKGDKGDPGQRGLDGLQGEKGEQGIPGKNGIDGRTQYTHIAYSNSADGSKDFSLSASDRSYIGMYVDFNATDSNTPSDYNWTLVKGSDGANGVAGKAGADGRTPYLHIAYSTSNNGSQGFSTTDSTNKTYIGTYTDYTQSDSQDYRVYKWTLIKGADGNGIANVTNYYLATAASTGITENSSGWTTTPQSMTEEKRYLWNYRVELYTNGTSKTTAPVIIGVHGSKGDKGGFSEEQLDEVNKKIDSKADQVLTQEQLNALNEKAQLLDAEMKAKASMEAFSELEKAYNAFVENNAKDTAQSEKDLIEAGRRIELLTTQFGGLAELKTFIDTYMKSSNEGLIIGKNDASSTIKVSSNRISMFSAGKEVMYISQGVIHIDNGIFTASVQIGKFRTEQYHLNADMNVIRYVG